MRWIPIILGSCLMLACIAGAVISLYDHDPISMVVFMLCGVVCGILTLGCLFRLPNGTVEQESHGPASDAQEVSRFDLYRSQSNGLVAGHMADQQSDGNYRLAIQKRVLTQRVAQAKRNKKKHSHLQAELDKLRGM